MFSPTLSRVLQRLQMEEEGKEGKERSFQDSCYIPFRDRLLLELQKEIDEADNNLRNLEETHSLLENAAANLKSELEEGDDVIQDSDEFERISKRINSLEEVFESLNGIMEQCTSKSTEDQEMAKELAIKKSQMENLERKKNRLCEEMEEQTEISKNAINFLITTIVALTEFCTLFFGIWVFCASILCSWSLFGACVVQILAITWFTHCKLSLVKKRAFNLYDENEQLMKTATELVNTISDSCRRKIDEDAPSNFPRMKSFEDSISRPLSLDEKSIISYEWSIWTPAMLIVVSLVGLALIHHRSCAGGKDKNMKIEELFNPVEAT